MARITSPAAAFLAAPTARTRRSADARSPRNRAPRHDTDAATWSSVRGPTRRARRANDRRQQRRAAPAFAAHAVTFVALGTAFALASSVHFLKFVILGAGLGLALSLLLGILGCGGTFGADTCAPPTAPSALTDCGEAVRNEPGTATAPSNCHQTAASRVLPPRVSAESEGQPPATLGRAIASVF